MTRRRQFPTMGTAGGTHHERESFRSGWGKARELLTSRIYHGDMPESDAVWLARWYSIRGELLSQRRDEFERRKDEFNQALPEELSGQLVNALKLVTAYMSEDDSR